MTSLVSFLNNADRVSLYNWLRWPIVFGVLGLSAALAYWVGTNNLTLILMVLVGAAGALIVLRWPALLVVSLSFIGMFTPAVGPQDLNLALVVVAGGLLLWLFDMVVLKREIRFVPSTLLRPAIGLIVAALLSFIVGQFPWFEFVANASMDAQLAGLAMFVLGAGAVILVANQVHELKWLKLMTWIVIGVGALFIVGTIRQPVPGIIKVIFRGGVMGGVYWAWLPALVFSQALVNKKLPPILRLGLFLLTALILYTRFNNYGWKSGWVPAFVAVFVIVWFWSWRAGLGLTLLAAGPVWMELPALLASDSYSISTRLDAWFILGEILRISPVLGLGFANYYWYTPLFRIRGFAVEFNSHNNYIDIIAQTGILGVACFLWLFIEAGRLIWRLRDNVPEGFAKAYVHGAAGGLVGTAVAALLGDWVLPFVYNVGMGGFRTGVFAFLFLGGLVVLERLYLSGGAEGAAA